MARTARALFHDRGYVATTIEAIAEAAGVAVPTIYSAFGNKKAILEEIRHLWIEESEVRPLLADALADSDLRSRVELAARWQRQQLERGHDVIQIYGEAARVDAAIAKLWSGGPAGRARSGGSSRHWRPGSDPG